MFMTKLDQVAERLRERIISGEYGRGEKLKQADIAAELGVSITPVREALKALEMEGFVVSVPHRGLLVPDIDPEMAREVFELRRQLERTLTERALANITREQVGELRAIQKELAKLAAGRDVYPVRAANVRFHFHFYEIARLPQTLQFARVLWAKFPFNFHSDQPTRFKQLVREHEAFLRRLEAGDTQGALDAMIAHIEAGWHHVSRNVLPPS